MLGNSELVAFVSTIDAARARAFYADVIGLRLVEESEYACVFDANGTMLRVTIAAEVAQPGYTVLGWWVADIAAELAALEAKGVTFTRYPGMEQDARGIWTTPGGDRVAWFTDPDGNNLSLTQFA